MSDSITIQKAPAGIVLYQKDARFILDLPSNSQDGIVQIVRQGPSHLRCHIPEGVRATIVDTVDGGDGEYGTEIFVGARAALTYISVRRSHDEAKMRIRQTGAIGAEASITWINATLGGAEIDHQLVSTLTGEGARSDVRWIAYGHGTEKYQLQARNIFQAPHGGGEIVMKGVAEGKAYIKYDGMIDIGLHGGGTDTYLTQEVLMLDKTAKVDAIPGLEIKTNDVKASHSATVSRVTEEDLFYFASRGILESEARWIFVEGFLADIVSGIADEATRLNLMQSIERKRERSGSIGAHGSTKVSRRL